MLAHHESADRADVDDVETRELFGQQCRTADIGAADIDRAQKNNRSHDKTIRESGSFDNVARGRRFFILLLSILCLGGCEKRSGEAVVLTKEHIAAAEIAPNEQPTVERAQDQPREMTAGEISVGGYVMPAEVRGTSRDPRATKDEQWLASVRATRDGRTFNVPVDQEQFRKLREGDRVEVRYRIGKYTGTVWSAEITR